MNAVEFLKNSNCVIADLQNDSRQIKSHDVFLAYPGFNSDGRDYINDAIAKGATAILYDPQNFEMNSCPIPCFAVENLANRLAELAILFYANPSRDLQITGFTGTNGKTTCAYLLTQAFEALGKRAAYIGTLGQGQIGKLTPLINTTPDALMLQKILKDYKDCNVNHVCMEVSSHALELNRVNGVNFNTAVYTNLSHEHLDFHKTLERYARAKAKLFAFESLQYALLNIDDPFFNEMRKAVSTNCEILTYGFNDKADVRVLDPKFNLNDSNFELISKWGKARVIIPAIGEFNIYNYLTVFCCLMLHGYNFNEVIALMAKIMPPSGRMEVITKKPYVIVDYAHTPDALENVLLTLRKLNPGKLITVFGCGGGRDVEKRPIMGVIAEKYSDLVIITSDNPRHEDPEKIIDEIKVGISNQQKIITIVSRKDAIKEAIANASDDDIVLIAGKGHENYQLIGDEREYFSDQDFIKGLNNLIPLTPALSPKGRGG